MKKKRGEGQTTPEPAVNGFSLAGIRKRHVSPLNDKVWRFLLYAMAGSAAAWFIRAVFRSQSTLAVWTMGILALASWAAAVRTLFFETKARKFWIVWLAVSLLILLIASARQEAGTGAAAFSFIFLLFRRYKPYWHLTPKRRSALFFLGFFVFLLLTAGFLITSSGSQPNRGTPVSVSQAVSQVIAQALSEKPGAQAAAPQTAPQARPAVQPSVSGARPPKAGTQAASPPPDPPTAPGIAVIGRNFAAYSLYSLRWFWFFSLFHLFFSIRLHFMKLRLKLAVSAILIAVVPVALLLVIAILTVYSTLGESRAARAAAVLNDWVELAGRDEAFLRTIGGRTETWDAGNTAGAPPPQWVKNMAAVMKAGIQQKGIPAAARDSFFVWTGQSIWLIRVTGRGTPDVRIAGTPLDETMLNRLAGILSCNVRLSFSNPVFAELSKELPIKVIKTDDQAPPSGLSGVYIPKETGTATSNTASSSNSFWRRPLYFGMSQLEVLTFESGAIMSNKILLLVEASLNTIVREFFSESNPLGTLVMGVLMCIAFMMLIFEGLALFFGVRISGGITSAVRALHKGTKRLAEGDLETRIEIPNEDELGDLAGSFNAMAAAVKRGREEAIARERLEQELETARQIQENLLPHKMPEVQGFEIAGTSIPSQQVGGDYFDFLETESGHLGIAIADVSGKGISAALLMSNIQAGLRAQIITGGEVSEIALRMNNLLVRSTDSHMFATFFFGILDRSRAVFTSTNAGHNPPFLLRADGRIERLEAGGLILGFLSDQQYGQQSVTIDPGDLLVLFTDGITEAAGPSPEGRSGNLFGEERLIDVLRAHRSEPAGEIQAAILRAISEHTFGLPQNDDITLVVIKRREGGEAVLMKNQETGYTVSSPS